MTTLRMKKLELVILKSDIEAVLGFLGKAENFQIDYPLLDEAPEDGKASRETPEVEAIIRDLEASRSFLGISDPGRPRADCPIPGDGEKIIAFQMIERVGALKARQIAANERLAAIRESLEESRAFVKLKLPSSELELLTFIVLRLGRVDPSRIEALREGLDGRAVIVPLDDSGRIAAISSKKGRFALDSELKVYDFIPIELPPDFSGISESLIASLESQEAQALSELESANSARDSFAQEGAARLPCLVSGFRMAALIEKTKTRLERTEQTYLLRGWCPKDSVSELVERLAEVTSGRVAVRSFNPEEISDVKKGRAQVPVSVKHGAFVRSFEGMVFSYGTPLYGSIDPTPLVAFFFVILFSIMFGDLGQGFVFLLVGFFLSRTRGKLKTQAGLAPIFVAIGIGSMIMGFLDGTVFSNETLLIPLTRIISTALFGRPLDRFVTLMPTEGVGKVIAFFGFTIAVGVIINSIGLIVNMINLYRQRHYGKMLFSKTGLAGSLFFWYAVGVALRLILKQPLFIWDSILPALCLIALFLGEALERLIDGHRPFPDGFLSFLIQGAVEVLESLSYYTSNTVSFLRVGAFALSHAVLSFIVFAMGDMVRRAVPHFGFLLDILVLIIGNLVIILLEGMVVAIQAIRLQYYEFFSKFFSETGMKFEPFSFFANAKP